MTDGQGGPPVLSPRVSALFLGPDVRCGWGVGGQGTGMQGWGQRRDVGRRNSVLSPLWPCSGQETPLDMDRWGPGGLSLAESPVWSLHVHGGGRIWAGTGPKGRRRQVPCPPGGEAPKHRLLESRSWGETGQWERHQAILMLIPGWWLQLRVVCGLVPCRGWSWRTGSH